MSRRYTLTIESGKAATEDESLRALRALLKAAKRCFGFRCLIVEPTPADTTQDDPQRTQEAVDES
jgi:hypothetical protein